MTDKTTAITDYTTEVEHYTEGQWDTEEEEKPAKKKKAQANGAIMLGCLSEFFFCSSEIIHSRKKKNIK